MRRIFYIFLAFSLVVSCISSPSQAARDFSDRKYYGDGRHHSFLMAMNLAKVDAVRQYLKEFLGSDYELHKEKISNIFSAKENPNQFVYAEYYQMVSKSRDKATGEIVLKIAVPVKKEVVQQVLLAQQPSLTHSSNPLEPIEIHPEINNDDWGELSSDEQTFIRRYINTLTYMVYYNEQSSVDPAVMRMAVTKANSYLAERNADLVDMNQVEMIKDDQRKVYEQESGQEMNFIPWIAQKLNADVYIEISAVSSTHRVSAAAYMAQVNLSLKIFDPSTGELSAEQSMNSPNVVGSGLLDAQIKAIQPSVQTIMPRVLDQFKAKLAKTLVRGLRYHVTIQKPSDAKSLNQFFRKLQTRVKLVSIIASSANESKFEVFFLGSVTDLENLIYQVAENSPGLEGLHQVLVHGRSLIFNTGLK